MPQRTNSVQQVEVPPDPGDVARRLAAPFDVREVQVRPVAFSHDKRRARAAFFVDARAIQQRLDDVVGCENWQTRFTFFADNPTDSYAVCKLSIRFGDKWMSKENVGGSDVESEDGSPTVRRKAAFSDAFKRVAVDWSIGRYLYSIPEQWADWDADKKDWRNGPPKLPGFALPNGESAKREREPQPVPGANGPTLAKLAAAVKKLDKSENAVRLSLSARFGEHVQTMAQLSQQQAEALLRDLDRLVRAMGENNNRQLARGMRGKRQANG
jgi:hypothetical protein